MSNQGEQRFTVQDEGIRRAAIDVARDIIREGDLRGSSAKHSTTILTRNVLQKLGEEIVELHSNLENARKYFDEIFRYSHENYIVDTARKARNELAALSSAYREEK